MYSMVLKDQPLVVEHIAPEKWWQRVHYRLVEPLEWNQYSIQAGFVSDGATVPRTVRWLFDPMGRYAKAAFIHDYLLKFYWRGGNGWMRRVECDREFRSAMKALGVPRWRRSALYSAVRLFAISTGRN